MTSNDCIELLKQLIATPRTSRNETAAADLLERYMRQQGMQPQRHGNNLWEVLPAIDSTAPTILLNAHIDTVKPVSAWTRDPFTPTIEPGPDGDLRLYGLGSNDDGASLVTLLATYLHFRTLRLNPTAQTSPTQACACAPQGTLIFLASAEEEVSGANGISSVLPLLPLPSTSNADPSLTGRAGGESSTSNADPSLTGRAGGESVRAGGESFFALVGEPTGMQPAIAEKGLMVLDCTAHGRAGHAARNEGDNAILHALDDIQRLRDYQFPDVSPLLGPVKLTTTIIQAGTQHNVIPDQCTFTVDVRSNECYTNQQIYAILQQELTSDIKARSFRLNSSRIDVSHPIVRRAIELGRTPFGSPTLSDQALIPYPSMKMGPGDSRRSHTADEYICLSEIEEALTLYRQLLCF